MEQHHTGYGAVTPNYGYGQDTGYASYLAPGPPAPSSYGNDAGNTYTGHYDTFGSGYDTPAPTYRPTGSYGAVGEPVKPAGYAPEQFASPSQEPSWQDYNNYGSNTQEYGRDIGNGYDQQVGYSNFSTQENYQQESAPPSYELGQGFNSNRGRPSFSGNQERGGRVGFDGTDGYTRGGRGAMRGRGKGHYGHEGQFEDINMGGGKFDGGSSRGRGGRGGRGGVGTGGGDFNNGTRGRGLFDSGNRGRGQFGRDTRGRGQFGDTRGRGQFGGDTRGRGQFGGDSRGRGQFGGLNRGRGATSRGRGSFDGGQSVRDREQFRGGSRGRGDFGSGNRGRGLFDANRGRGQVGNTRGRGWVPAGSSSLGQDASRGRGQYGARGNKQTGNRGRGQDTASGRGQQVGVQEGLQEAARRGGLVSAGHGRGDGGVFSTPATKATKPFKMSSADAQGFISYKNNLQEYAQKSHKPIPQYTSQKADVGFTANVSVDGQMYSCLQSQREKKDAEQGAAFEALKALGYIDANDMFSPKLGTGKAKKRPSEDGDVATPNAKVAKQEPAAPGQAAGPAPTSYKSKLNERIMKMRLDLPTYSTIRTAGGFLSTLVLNGQVYQGVKAYGTKKLAEQHVAEIVFTQLDFKVEATPGEAIIVVGSDSDAALSTPETQKELSAITSTSSKPPSAPKAKPMKNIVQEYCQKNGMQIPIYNSVKDAGMFIATVTVNGVEYVGTPHIMKKTAEQNAAKKVCEELGLKF